MPRPARRLCRLVPVLAFLALAACDYPPTDTPPGQVSDLGATPDHSLRLASADTMQNQGRTIGPQE